MHDPKSFSEFLELARSSPGISEATQLIRSVARGASSWSKNRCSNWLPDLTESARPEGDLFSLELLETESEWVSCQFEEAVVQLLLSVRGRLFDLGNPPPTVSVAEVLADWAQLSTTFNVPSRELLSVYRVWIEWGFVPGIGQYQLQVREVVDGPELVELVETIRVDDGEGAELAHSWIKLALDVALVEEPSIVPTWLNHLREAWGNQPDPYDESLINRYESLLKLVRGPSELPTELAIHLTAESLHSSVLISAKTALIGAASDSWTCSRNLFEGLLDRDVRLLQPSLPRHLGTACEAALELLRVHEQLRQLGRIPPVVGCSLLTLAVEAQARAALARNLRKEEDREYVTAINELSLAGLARLIRGDYMTAPFDELELDGWNSEKEEYLTESGRIRDRVHHANSSVESNHHSSLAYSVMHTESSAPQLLSALSGIVCRPRSRR